MHIDQRNVTAVARNSGIDLLIEDTLDRLAFGRLQAGLGQCVAVIDNVSHLGHVVAKHVGDAVQK